MANIELYPITRIQGTVDVTSLPSTNPLQARYDLGAALIYMGTATRGLATDAPGWTIARIELVSGNPVTKQWANAATVTWDNRAAPATIYT